MGKWGLLLLLLMVFLLSSGSTRCTVTYDRKAIIINGEKRLLFSGSIHYPRSTPEMWEDLILKAKEGGLDVIDTYVFLNGHEPSPGNVHFSYHFKLLVDSGYMERKGFRLEVIPTSLASTRLIMKKCGDDEDCVSTQ